MDDTQQQHKAPDRRHGFRAGLKRYATKVFHLDNHKSPASSPAASPMHPVPHQVGAAATRHSTDDDTAPATTTSSAVASSASVPVATTEEHKPPAPGAFASKPAPRLRTVSSSEITLAPTHSDSNSSRRHSSALPVATTATTAIPIAAVSLPMASSTENQDVPSPMNDDEQFDEREYNYDDEHSDIEHEENEENQNANAQQLTRSDSSSTGSSPLTNALTLTLGLATAEGLMGHANEDRIVVEQHEHFHLLAVLDGHGGGWTADVVKDKLFGVVAQCYNNGFDVDTLAAAIDALDVDIQAQATQRQDYSGACMVCVLLFIDGATGEPQTLTLNVGDCRAIVHEARGKGKHVNKGVGPNGRLYALSTDHCEANKSETARVLASGAYIEYGRIGGVLEPFRSIGDIDMKERDMPGWVIATPEVKRTRLMVGRSTFVLATDGVWGSLVNQKVMTLVRKSPSDLQAGADAIIKAAREAGSLDDIAVIVAHV